MPSLCFLKVTFFYINEASLESKKIQKSKLCCIPKKYFFFSETTNFNDLTELFFLNEVGCGLQSLGKPTTLSMMTSCPLRSDAALETYRKARSMLVSGSDTGCFGGVNVYVTVNVNNLRHFWVGRKWENLNKKNQILRNLKNQWQTVQYITMHAFVIWTTRRHSYVSVQSFFLARIELFQNHGCVHVRAIERWNLHKKYLQIWDIFTKKNILFARVDESFNWSAVSGRRSTYPHTRSK